MKADVPFWISRHLARVADAAAGSREVSACALVAVGNFASSSPGLRRSTMKYERRGSPGILKAAIVAMILVAAAVLSQHLAFHEFQGHDHEDAAPAAPAIPAHEHHLMTPAPSGVLQILAAAAFLIAGAACVFLTRQQTAAPHIERDYLQFGALRAGPDLSLQPLLATYLI